jgi:hypothetical protein
MSNLKRKLNVVPSLSPSPSILTVSTLPEAFLAVQAEILAVPLAALVPICVDVPTVTRAVMGSIDELATLLPDLAGLPDYDLKKVTHLNLYAAAALYAHLVVPLVDPKRLRARAFTLFAQAHDEALRGVSFLRWYEGDWDTFLAWNGRHNPEDLMSECAWERMSAKKWIDGKEVPIH